ncbi:unnamed protein product [Paramecium primaurelia]|uniref:WD40-repeat-containing domain n=1 Tax=Paramecium primaurelia TaxID=5886 RepID=A0A8S1NQL4_PARPR|nr:unnamed protein product [Paramecium primaurelia]
MSEQQIPFCQHNEKFIAVQSAEKAKLCLECLAIKGKAILIEDQMKNVQNMKSLFNKEKQEQVQKNIASLEELKTNINLLKQFYINQADKINQDVESWKSQIKASGDSFIAEVNKQEQYDMQQFLSSVQQLQNTYIKHLSQFKINIEELLKQLQLPEILQTCNKNLENIQFVSNVDEKKRMDQMQDNLKVQLNIFCEKHTQKRIKILDMGSENNKSRRLACRLCLDQYNSQNYKSVEHAHSEWNKIVKKRQESLQRNLLEIQGKVQQINENMQSMQEKIKQSVDQNLTKLDNNYNQYKLNVEQSKKEMNLEWQNLSREEILKILDEMNKIQNISNSEDPLQTQYTNQDKLVNQIVKDNFLFLQECQLDQITQLNPYIQNQIFDEITTLFKKKKPNPNLNQIGKIESEVSKNNYLIQQEEQPIKKINNTNFTYNLMKESSIKEEQSCRAMVFNQNCSIILVGCNQYIYVFEFRQGIMKQNQILTEHENNVITLNFMKKSNQFISGSEGDGLIIIWQLNSNNEWILQQRLKEHSQGIRCLILNENEDLFVSGGLDNKIIFWAKQNQWIVQQIIQKQCVYALSLNEQQNKLISCAQDNQILILEYQKQKKKWNIKQKIPIQQKGIRVCFIDDNLFILQTYLNDLLDVYEMKNANEYTKTKGIQVMRGQEDESPFFPQQYIKSRRLLVNKNCQYINIIKNNENGEFVTQQSIEFQSSKLYGSMSDDAQYLITWDEISKEIQIRKYQEL